jgi:ribosomal protein S18 acetylase RimI-like enzyme
MDNMLRIALEDIVIGLLGAFVVSTISYIVKKVKNNMLERQFPIAGDYLTKFEDEVDGQRIVTTAPASLKQHGTQIVGSTAVANDNRNWIIEGEVSLEGYFHGIYHAEDPIDTGIGNFILKIDNRRHMQGMWSGYDSVNGKITSGEYKFFPIHRNIEFHILQKVHIPQITEIADDQLGKDYLTDEDLERILSAPEHYVCAVALDKPHAKVVGFCLGLQIQQHEIKDYIHLAESDIPRSIKNSERIGLLKTIAIDQEHQRLGIGFKLTEKCVTELISRKVQTIISIAWQNGCRVNMHGILSGLKFRKVKEIPFFWKNDSLKKGYSCPMCGQPPCKCTAVIYAMSVPEEGSIHHRK